MTISEAKGKVVSWALSQVGYKETGTNINKYAADIDKNYPSYFNTPKQGAEWCAVFVTDDFLVHFTEGDVHKMLYTPKKCLAAGCPYAANYFRKNNAFFSSPEVGDQVFFGAKGREKHTGIVVEVTCNEVVTVEGNKSNAVKKCRYNKNSSEIAGYGRPKWSVVAEEDHKTVEVELYELKSGDKNFQVGTVQRILRERGYKYQRKLIAVDESFGPATEDCVKQFQKAWGLKVDGIVGLNTWNKLLKGR